VGVLVVREGIELEPLVEGGGQERGLRSGTSNVMGAVGMAAALRATVRDREATVARVGALRDRLVDGLLAAVPGARENGDRAHKVAGNAHLVFPGAEAEALLVLLDQAALDAAAGSSCSSGATELSHVLVAMGLAPEVASCSVRFSLGASSNDDDVARALVIVPEAVAKLRAGA
jgi:cysteine desulfurase